MTPEEITKLVEEYVEEIYPHEEFEDIGQMDFLRNTAKKNIASFIRWLLRTHCIVSKEKATELCRLTLEHGSSIDYGLIDGLTDIVCDIFREQYHAEAEKTDFDPDTFDETDK